MLTRNSADKYCRCSKTKQKKKNSESFVAAREKSHFRSALLNKINSDVWFRKKKAK